MTVKTNHTGQVNRRSPPQKDDPFFFSLSLSLFPSFLPLGISLLLACLLAEGMGPGPQGDPGISLSLSRVGGRGSIQAPTPCGPHTRGSWRDKLPPPELFFVGGLGCTNNVQKREVPHTPEQENPTQSVSNIDYLKQAFVGLHSPTETQGLYDKDSHTLDLQDSAKKKGLLQATRCSGHSG